MIVVTGGYGFIGSNVIKQLNDMGHGDIVVIDNLENGKKILNLADCHIRDFIHRNEMMGEFFEFPMLPGSGDIEAVIHLGACSSTTEWNGNYVMKNNYQFSMKLLDFCLHLEIPFVYASSASVYGLGENGFHVDPKCEQPLNPYAYSKLLFDQHVRRIIEGNQYKSLIVGLRYFNVYGPREQHKGNMASVVRQFYQQSQKRRTIIGKERNYTGKCIDLFGEYDGRSPGEHERDFIHVDDAVKVTLWAMKSDTQGIFNVGTGKARSFNDVAKIFTNTVDDVEINYIKFPEKLKGAYQSYTCADIETLRAAGYADDFITLEDGVTNYIKELNNE